MSNAKKVISEVTRRAAANQQPSVHIRTTKGKAIPDGVIQEYKDGRWLDVFVLPLWSDAERRELAAYIDAK